ncbi:hypothetical protein [Candidatus Electronema sp. JC]|uniref:hypothetical protein n=1 Tax=Candidatus Electronema sp. JC TaxID=3401570 RepID=UPI003B42D4EB
MTKKLSAAGAAAAVMLLLAGAAAAQQQNDDGALRGGNVQGMPMMPDVSGIQQRMQAQMMQQMTQQMAGQMQSASPAAQMTKGAPQQTAPAPGQAAQQGVMMPDMSGIQQRMQAQMMQQMTQQMAGQMQSASPAAGQAAQGGTMMMPAVPDSMMRLQMQNVLGLDPAAAQPEPNGGLQIDSAISSIKMDPAVQSTINEKMMKIMEQTMRETFADPKMRQEMQQRFLINGITPGAGQAKQP